LKLIQFFIDNMKVENEDFKEVNPNLALLVIKISKNSYNGLSVQTDTDTSMTLKEDSVSIVLELKSHRLIYLFFKNLYVCKLSYI